MCGLRSVEVADEHDVGVVLVELGIEHVAAVGRDGDAVGKFAIGFEDFPSMPGGKIIEGKWSLARFAERNKFRL